MEGRTSVRCKDLGWVVNRGERLNKQRDSLFSTKAVEAVPVFRWQRGKALYQWGHVKVYRSGVNCEWICRKSKRSPTAVDKYCAFRGKQPRSIDKASNFLLSAKGSEIPRTTWRWAWKQPSVKKRVTTYKRRDLAPEIQETKKEAEAVILWRKQHKR